MQKNYSLDTHAKVVMGGTASEMTVSCLIDILQLFDPATTLEDIRIKGAENYLSYSINSDNELTLCD